MRASVVEVAPHYLLLNNTLLNRSEKQMQSGTRRRYVYAQAAFLKSRLRNVSNCMRNSFSLSGAYSAAVTIHAGILSVRFSSALPVVVSEITTRHSSPAERCCSISPAVSSRFNNGVGVVESRSRRSPIFGTAWASCSHSTSTTEHYERVRSSALSNGRYALPIPIMAEYSVKQSYSFKARSRRVEGDLRVFVEENIYSVLLNCKLIFLMGCPVRTRRDQHMQKRAARMGRTHATSAPRIQRSPSL